MQKFPFYRELMKLPKERWEGGGEKERKRRGEREREEATQILSIYCSSHHFAQFVFSLKQAT